MKRKTFSAIAVQSRKKIYGKLQNILSTAYQVSFHSFRSEKI